MNKLIELPNGSWAVVTSVTVRPWGKEEDQKFYVMVESYSEGIVYASGPTTHEQAKTTAREIAEQANQATY